MLIDLLESHLTKQTVHIKTKMCPRCFRWMKINDLGDQVKQIDGMVR